MRTITFGILALVAACTQAAPTPAEESAATVAQGSAAAPPAKHALEADDDVPAEKFTGGAKAFADVREALAKSYYAEGLTDDDLYRAATAGMLEKLEPRFKKYNKLLAPAEVAEMQNDLKGEVVGIGVVIQFDEKSGYADVMSTLPKSPSEKAGLLAGDKIVTVNGKLYKGMKFIDVVRDIRGKAGDPVTLSVLRADKLQTFTVVRDRVAFDTPERGMLPDHAGYLHIPSFTEKTPSSVKSALEELEKGGAKSLILDLRQNQGGLFESSIDTADLFVPPGTPIVSLKRRDKPLETHSAKGKPILGNVPMVVLVDGGTASSAEFLAGALHESRHARLLGTKTTGKWSVQAFEKLPNGYAYKYTVSMFQTPSGKSYEGVGIAPDFELAMDEAALNKANAMKVEERLPADVQLRTAKELLVPGP